MASSTQTYVPETYSDEVASSPIEFPTNLDTSDFNNTDNENDARDNDREEEQEGSVPEEGKNSVEDSGIVLAKADELTEFTFGTSIMTHHSSSVANLSFILDPQLSIPSQAQDEQKSPYELVSKTCHLCMQMKAYEGTIMNLQAEISSSNAHCTLAHREIGDVWMKLDHAKKKKMCNSTKIKAWFLTHPELKEAFKKEEVECQKQQQINAEKVAQKSRKANERAVRINKDSFMKMFDHPLPYYKKKDDLITIASALKLPTEGTIPVLMTCSKDHLKDHPELSKNP